MIDLEKFESIHQDLLMGQQETQEQPMPFDLNRLEQINTQLGQLEEPEPGYIKTFAKGLARGGESILGGVGSITRWVGDVSQSEAISKGGEWFSKYWNQAAQEGWEAPDPRIFNGSFLDNPSFKRAVGIVGEAIPSLFTALGIGTVGTAAAGLTAGGAAAAGALGLLEGAPQYEEAREKGLGVGEASVAGLVSTAGTALLEYLPIGHMLKGVKGGPIAKTLIGGVEEGVQEATQTVFQNLVAKIGYDDTQQLFEGIVESMIGGFGSGAIAGPTVSKLNNVMAKNQKKLTEKDVQDAHDIIQSNIEAVSREMQKPVTTTTPLEQDLKKAEKSQAETGLGDDDLNKDIINKVAYGKEKALPPPTKPTAAWQMPREEVVKKFAETEPGKMFGPENIATRYQTGTVDDLNRYSQNEIKNLAGSYGIPTTGTKRALIDRLIAHRDLAQQMKDETVESLTQKYDTSQLGDMINQLTGKKMSYLNKTAKAETILKTLTGREEAFKIGTGKAIHKKSVRQAIAEGKPVSDKILEPYVTDGEKWAIDEWTKRGYEAPEDIAAKIEQQKEPQTKKDAAILRSAIRSLSDEERATHKDLIDKIISPPEGDSAFKYLNQLAEATGRREEFGKIMRGVYGTAEAMKGEPGQKMTKAQAQEAAGRIEFGPSPTSIVPRGKGAQAMKEELRDLEPEAVAARKAEYPPVEEIEAGTGWKDWLDREIKPVKDTKRYIQKLEQQLAKKQKALADDSARYNDIRDRGVNALSDYDRNMGYGIGTGMMLKGNHIRADKAQIALIENKLAELKGEKPTMAAAEETARVPAEEAPAELPSKEEQQAIIDEITDVAEEAYALDQSTQARLQNMKRSLVKGGTQFDKAREMIDKAKERLAKIGKVPTAEEGPTPPKPPEFPAGAIKATINIIDKLGSIEAANEKFSGDADLDKWARDYAEYKFGRGAMSAAMIPQEQYIEKELEFWERIEGPTNKKRRREMAIEWQKNNIRTAFNVNQLSVEQAEELGHFEAYPDLEKEFKTAPELYAMGYKDLLKARKNLDIESRKKDEIIDALIEKGITTKDELAEESKKDIAADLNKIQEAMTFYGSHISKPIKYNIESLSRLMNLGRGDIKAAKEFRDKAVQKMYQLDRDNGFWWDRMLTRIGRKKMIDELGVPVKPLAKWDTIDNKIQEDLLKLHDEKSDEYGYIPFTLSDKEPDYVIRSKSRAPVEPRLPQDRGTVAERPERVAQEGEREGPPSREIPGGVAEEEPTERPGGGTGAELRGARRPAAEEGAERGPVPTGERVGRERGPDVNHIIEPDDVLAPTGPETKIKSNIKAIKLLKSLEKANRNPTVEEKKILAQYVGWGAFSEKVFTRDFDYYFNNMGKYSPEQLFRPEIAKKYRAWENKYGKALHPKLGGLLTDEQWKSARASTKNAHYTSKQIINKMWDMARHFGFTGGAVLEPAAGVGHFIGLAPGDIATNSVFFGIEKDDISGGILKKLYPQANIQVAPFERSKGIDDNSMDLVITNVPFGKIKIADKAHKQFDGWSIHNYFIGRSIAAAKPGGMAIAISSAFTMDAKSGRNYRNAYAQNADLIGAIRLPNTAFKENAGTDVVTDILIFRKKDSAYTGIGNYFASVNPIESKDYLNARAEYENQSNNFERIKATKPAKSAKRGEKAKYKNAFDLAKRQMREALDALRAMPSINEYFLANPDMIMGENSTKGTMYAKDTYTVLPTGELGPQVDAAIQTLPANIMGEGTDLSDLRTVEIAKEGQKEGVMFLNDQGIPKMVQNGRVVDPQYLGIKKKVMTFGPMQLERAKKYLQIKSSAVNLIELMGSEDTTDEQIAAGQKELNKLYDAYVKKFNAINDKSNSFLRKTDNEFAIVDGLELKKDKAGITYYQKAPIFTKRTIYPFVEPTTADNIEDAVSLSIIYRGEIQPAYVADLTGSKDIEATKQQIIDDGFGYINPQTGLIEQRDLYLSGNVKIKLRQAKEALAQDKKYQKNIDALEKVIPEDLDIEFINLRIGTTWIPIEAYQDFAKEIFETDVQVVKEENDESNFWKVIPLGSMDSVKNRKTFGSANFTATELLEKGLNLRRPKVMVQDPETRSTYEDKEQTEESTLKMRENSDEFVRWVKSHEKWAGELARIYNEEKNGSVLRTQEAPNIDVYPNASPIDIDGNPLRLREHQKIAVSRALQESVLMAYGVGTGKTYIFITTAMEMRRIGTAKKPLIVAHNSTIDQYRNSFKTLYPSSKVLIPDSSQRSSQYRTKTLTSMATGDWDAIVLPQSFFDGIANDPARESAFVDEQIAQMEDALIDARAEEGRGSWKVKELETMIENRKQRLEKLLMRRKDEALTFEQMGIDALLIDEVHNYKRSEFYTKMDKVKGIDNGSSQKSTSLLLKAEFIREKTGGKNIITATGTPISNTLAELWTMMRYVRPDLLQEFGVSRFDSFATTFGDVVTALEKTAKGYDEVSRFSKYVNGPELLSMFFRGADVRLTKDANLKLPDVTGGKPQIVINKRNNDLTAYISSIIAEWKAWENLTGREKRKNMHVPVVLYGRAKKAAVDMRLVDPKYYTDDPESKVNTAVNKIAEIYKAGTKDRTAQIVFVDLIHEDAKARKFNLHKDIKNKLADRGINPDEVELFSLLKNEKKEEAAKERIRTGESRIIIGTTAKLGVGVDIADRLIAAHHITVPDRPMDIEQRDGRIIRQSNNLPEVQIYHYATEDTLDSVMFDRLVRKQKASDQILSGDISGREFEDPFSEEQASFAEFAASASGKEGKLLFELNDVIATLRKYRIAEQAHVRKISEARRQTNNIPDQITYYEKELVKATNLAAYVKKTWPEGKIENLTIDGTEMPRKEAYAIIQGKVDDQIKQWEKEYIGKPMGDFMRSPPKLEAEIKANAGDIQLTYYMYGNTNYDRKAKPSKKLGWGEEKVYDPDLDNGKGAWTYRVQKIEEFGITGHFKKDLILNSPMSENAIASGSTRRINMMLDQSKDYPDELKGRIKKHKEGLAEYKEILKTPFAYTDKIAELSRRQNEINRRLIEMTSEKAEGPTVTREMPLLVSTDFEKQELIDNAIRDEKNGLLQLINGKEYAFTKSDIEVWRNEINAVAQTPNEIARKTIDWIEWNDKSIPDDDLETIDQIARLTQDKIDQAAYKTTIGTPIPSGLSPDLEKSLPAMPPGVARFKIGNSAEELANHQKAAEAVEQALKDAGVSESIRSRIGTELTPMISLKDVNIEETMADWQADGRDMNTVLGATTIDGYRALIQLSLAQDLAQMERTTYHEAFHVLSQWVLPESERNRLMKFYVGNEEAAAEAFSDFIAGRKQPMGIIRRIMRTIKNLLASTRNLINGLGFTTPEQIFTSMRDKPILLAAESERLAGDLDNNYYFDQLKPDIIREAKLAWKDETHPIWAGLARERGDYDNYDYESDAYRNFETDVLTMIPVEDIFTPEELGNLISTIVPPTRLAVAPPPPAADVYEEHLPEEPAKRMKESKLGRESLKDRVINGIKETIATFTPGNMFPKLKGASFGKAREVLRNFNEVSNYSKWRATEDIAEILDPKRLTPAQYDLLSLKIILDDMMMDTEEDGPLSEYEEVHGELPFGFKDADELQQSIDKINASVDNTPAVQTALTRREDYMKRLRKELVDAKLLPKSVLDDPRYFHHQVLEYANEKYGTGTGSRDVRVHGKGYQIHRVGSIKDYNTQYLESEFEVISQGLSQLEARKNVDELGNEYDIRPQLAEQADQANYVAVVGGPSEFNRLQRLIGQRESMSKRDPDRKDLTQEIWNLDPTMPYRQKMAIAVSKLQGEGIDVIGRDGRVNLVAIADLADRGNANALMYFKAVTDRRAFLKQTLGPAYRTWQTEMLKAEPLPGSAGWAEWIPKPGSAWYQTNTINDKILEQVIKGERQLTDEDVKQVLARGYDVRWVLPVELAETMDGADFINTKNDNVLGRAAERSLNLWKQWILLNPLRVLKYNINNTSGDLDIAIAYQPKILKYTRQAAIDLHKHMRGKKIGRVLEAEINEAMRNGAIGSGITVHDIPDIKSATQFDTLMEALNPTKRRSIGYIKRFWRGTKEYTTWRENILRLAAYRYFTAEIEAGRKPYGVSDKATVDATTDTARKAALLARELIGDYGNLSKGGQWLRQKAIPFYSWMEINAPRYYRLFKNLPLEGEQGGRGKRAAGVLAKKGTMLAVRASFLFTMIHLFNRLFWPDEEEELGESGRRQLHLILGRRADGSIMTLRLQGALSDALGWIGLEDAPEDARQLMMGNRSVMDQVRDMGLAPINRIVNAIRPDIKTAAETIAGRTIYPDITRPRPIRDKAENIARMFSLDSIYRRLRDRPSKEKGVIERVLADLGRTVTYTTDPGEAAYHDTRTMTARYLEKEGIERPAAEPTSRSNALYYYRQALKYGDGPAAHRYLQKYIELGGNVKGMRVSLKRAHPLAAIPRRLRNRFMSSLSPENRKTVRSAINWYNKTYR